MKKLNLCLMLFCLSICTAALAQQTQKVEGFNSVVFQYNANRSLAVRDFLGSSKGYMTAGWWAKDQMKDNILSWKTAEVPEKKPTTFVFVGSSCVLPLEIVVGPSVKLMVNGKYALTFTLGRTHDYTWKEGEYQLKYYSKRVEFPYTGSQREFSIDGNSGIYQLSVPASAVESGKACEIQVEILPNDRWNNGWFMVKDRKNVLDAPKIADLTARMDAMQVDLNNLQEQTDILATKLYSKMLGNDKFENSIIYTDGYKHLHPADMIKLKNGDILVTAREASEHFANDGDVIMLRSKDNGKTWGDKRVICGIKDLDEREGCGIQLKDGTIIVGCFYNDLYTVDGTYNWAGNGKLPPSTHPRLGTLWVTSKDNGYTWSKPKYMDIKGMPVSGIEGPTDAPIELPDGSIVMGVIGYGINGDKSNVGCVFLKSTDKGNTWKFESIIAQDPGRKYGGFAEPGIVRTKTGRILAALRCPYEENNIWMSYSDDNGKTWAPIWKTDMIGHPTDLIQLKDGRILATYGIRVGTGRHTEPGGIRACFSNDNGLTWDIKNEVILRSDFLNWDIGYPESLQLPDGKILSAYYFNLFGKYFLGQTIWNP